MSRGIDVGLLSPVTVGHDDAVTDAAVTRALITVEAALIRAYAAVGADVPPGLATAVEEASIDAAALAAASVAGGNPIIPLVGLLKEQVPAADRAWVHRGATSQDILDSALMLVARTATARGRRVARGDRGGAGGFRRRAPRPGRRRADPHPARRAHDGRAPGRELAARCPPGFGATGCRRGGAAGPARRRGRHAGRVRRGRRGSRCRRASFGLRPGARARDARSPVAHDPLAGDRTRRRAGAGPRRARRHRRRRRNPLAHRDRRARRGIGRWIVGHAAEAEPGGIRADPLGRASRTPARRDAASRRGARGRRAPGRRLACGMADAARAAAAGARCVRARGDPRAAGCTSMPLRSCAISP